MTDPRRFDRILCAVDEHSTDGALRAFELADRFDAKLRLIHAVEIPPVLWPGVEEDELASMHASALSHARERTGAALEVAFRGAGFPAGHGSDQLAVLHGKPAAVILEQAREFEADLVVLGPHKRKKPVDFGSTTRAVLSRSEVPVWTQIGRVDPPRKLLVPVDFSVHTAPTLACATILAERYGASIELLHCFTPPDFAFASETDPTWGPTYVIDQARSQAQEELSRLHREYEWKSVEAVARFEEGDVVAKILERSAKHDMVVIGTHGRTGLSRFLLGSVAYGVARSSPEPVLTVPFVEATWQV